MRRTETRGMLVLTVLVGILIVSSPSGRSNGETPSPSVAGAGRGPHVVRVVKGDGGFQLLRDGKPYFIKGAGGDGPMEALARAGGNSLRTWGADKVGPILDEAERLGLTVTVGIWLGHERHGFDYTDVEQVARQYEQARETIL